MGEITQEALNIMLQDGKTKDNLKNNKDIAMLSYTLATIKTDCDIDVNINDFKYDFYCME